MGSTVGRIPDIARSLRHPAMQPFYVFEKLHNFRVLSTALKARISDAIVGNQSPDIPCSMVMIVSSWVNTSTNTVYIGGQELGPAGVSPGGIPVANGLELDPGRGVILQVDDFDDRPIREVLGHPRGEQDKLRAINLRDIWHMCPAALAGAPAIINVVYMQRGV